MNANDYERSIFSFVRKSKDGKNNLLFVISFTPVERDDYRVGVPGRHTYKLVLNSADPQFVFLVACCRKKVVSFIVSRFSALVNRYGDGVSPLEFYNKRKAPKTEL